MPICGHDRFSEDELKECNVEAVRGKRKPRQGKLAWQACESRGVTACPAMNESDRVEQVRLSSRQACESQEDSQHARMSLTV